jgi:hypothetical protein
MPPPSYCREGRLAIIVGIEFQLKVRVPLFGFVFMAVVFIFITFPTDAHREVVLSVSLAGA